MKNVNRIGVFIFALFLVLGMPTLMLTVPGCTTSQQRIGYNTIYSLEKVTTAAYDGYIGEVIQGRTPTNDVPKVSKAYNSFQTAMIVAIDGVEFNTNSLAPANLERLSQDLFDLIRSINAKNKKE